MAIQPVAAQIIGGQQPAYRGVQPVEPVEVEVVELVPEPILRGEGEAGNLGHIHGLADSSTNCARRQVSTDPLERRTIPSRRLPSSLVISRPDPLGHPSSLDDPMSPGISTRMPSHLAR